MCVLMWHWRVTRGKDKEICATPAYLPNLDSHMVLMITKVPCGELTFESLAQPMKLGFHKLVLIVKLSPQILYRIGFALVCGLAIRSKL